MASKYNETSSGFFNYNGKFLASKLEFSYLFSGFARGFLLDLIGCNGTQALQGTFCAYVVFTYIGFYIFDSHLRRIFNLPRI